MLGLLSRLANSFHLTLWVYHESLHYEGFILINLKVMVGIELLDLDEALEHLGLVKDASHIIFITVIKRDNLGMYPILKLCVRLA